MSTRRDGKMDVPDLEPPTRLLSARQLREQLGVSGALAPDEREAPTRPLSRAELEREIAQAEAAAAAEAIAAQDADDADDADDVVTHWLPRSLGARRQEPCVTRLEVALPRSLVPRPAIDAPVTRLEHVLARPMIAAAAPRDVTVTSLEVGELRAEIPRLGARPLPPASVQAPAALATGFQPDEPASGPRPARRAARSLVSGRRAWAALLASLLLLLIAVSIGAMQRASRRAARPPRAASHAPAMAVQQAPPVRAPAPAAVPLPPGSPRRALDLLLEGQREQALDAYRALAHERPSEPVYARLGELLEREVGSWAEAGTCP